MAGYKPGAHCRLDYIREANRRKLPPELRAELTRVVGEIAGRRLPDVEEAVGDRRSKIGAGVGALSPAGEG